MVNPMMKGGFGLVLIVVFLTCLLTGTAIGQIYTYFTQYPNDRRWMKGMVGTLVILDFMSTFFATAWMFNVLISDAHNPDILDATSNWLLGLNPLFCGLTGFIVHCFFTWRIYLITRSKVLSGLVMLGGTCAGTGALSTSVTAIIRIPVEQFQRLPFGPMWLVGTALTDVVISVSLSYHLRQKRGDFQGTNHVLDKLIRMTVQNGLLTAAVAIADLALFLSFKSPLHTVSFLMPKLYVNTVLSSLNARQVEKENNSWALSTLEHGPTASTIPRSSRPQTMSRASMISALPPRFNVDVAVTEVSETEYDDTEDLHAAGKHVHGRGNHISLQTDATGVMKPTWNRDVKNYLH